MRNFKWNKKFSISKTSLSCQECFCGFLLEYLSVPADLLQPPFDTWWLIRLKPQSLNSCNIWAMLCFSLLHILTLLFFPRLVWACSFPFVSRSCATPSVAHIDDKTPRGSVCRDGMWSFSNGMTEDGEGRKKNNAFQTFQSGQRSTEWKKKRFNSL